MINSTLKNANILIVDDQQANIDVLADLLDMLSYTNVKTTTDPRLVVGLYNEFKPDLILLDLMMPHLSGFQVMDQLKDHLPHVNYLPILVLTADVSAEAKKRALAGGAKDFLTKPFDLIEINLRIKNLLETRYLHIQQQNQNQILEQKVKERTIELENANKELQLLDQAKSDFLAVISHEINTPLNGILGFIEILKIELEKSEHSKIVKYLELSAKRLHRFSKVAMLITGLKTKNMPVIAESVPLIQLMERAKEGLKDQIKFQGVNLIIEGDMEKSSVSGDPMLLVFCFDSILGNAIKYSPQDSTVTIRVNSDRKQTICTFIDQGSGFSPIALNNLYKLFTPGEKHIDQNKGLDLSLVKLIMDMHQGHIEVRNNDTRGATVTLTFTDHPKALTNQSPKQAQASH